MEYTNSKRPHGRLQIQSACSNSVKSESLFTYKQLAQCVSSSSRIAVLAGYTHTGSVPAGYLCLSRINLCLPLFTPPRPTKADGNFFVADLTEKYGAFHRLPSTMAAVPAMHWSLSLLLSAHPAPTRLPLHMGRVPCSLHQGLLMAAGCASFLCLWPRSADS